MILLLPPLLYAAYTDYTKRIINNKINAIVLIVNLFYSYQDHLLYSGLLVSSFSLALLYFTYKLNLMPAGDFKLLYALSWHPINFITIMILACFILIAEHIALKEFNLQTRVPLGVYTGISISIITLSTFFV